MLLRANRELGQTTLMITHNPEAAAIAGRIMTMRDGQIVKEEARGTGRRSSPVRRADSIDAAMRLCGVSVYAIDGDSHRQVSTVIVSLVCCFKRPTEKLWHLLTALAVPFLLTNCLYWHEAFQARARDPIAFGDYEMWAPPIIIFCSCLKDPVDRGRVVYPVRCSQNASPVRCKVMRCRLRAGGPP